MQSDDTRGSGTQGRGSRTGLRAAAALLAAAVGVSGLAGCADSETAPETESQSTRYGQYFWQGDICMTRTQGGKPKRVAPSNCPPKQ